VDTLQMKNPGVEPPKTMEWHDCVLLITSLLEELVHVFKLTLKNHVRALESSL